MRLIRVAQSQDGTFGVLVNDDLPIAVTLEDPWNNNKKGESCIPEGEYNCVPHNGGKWQNVWELLGVKDRSAILIHSGNTIDDSSGCLLVGKQFGKINGRYGILNSAITLNELRVKLPRTFKLKIINAYGEKT